MLHRGTRREKGPNPPLCFVRDLLSPALEGCSGGRDRRESSSLAFAAKLILSPSPAPRLVPSAPPKLSHKRGKDATSSHHSSCSSIGRN